MRCWWVAGWLILGAILLPGQAHGEQTPPASTTAAEMQTSGTSLDLDDPKVRERLRASGVDPEELQRLLQAKQQMAAPAASSLPVQEFPPVPPPPGARVQAESTSTDSLAQADGPAYYGYDIFKLSPKIFEPLAFGPVSQDYLVGPGDEVIVNVWGTQEMYAKVEVNREGYIFLPDLGQVLVNGHTLGGLKSVLEQRLAKIYSGLRSDGKGRAHLDVTLGKLRSIQVFVLGGVIQPGAYTLSATSTVMSAMYYAGGPTAKGTMRNVRLLRNNRVIQEIDLYDYVAKGDRTQDARLESGDVIFVPPVGIRVHLEGEVSNAAIYELRPGETIADLLQLAGGLNSTAYLERVQVERIIPFADREPMSQEDRKILDLNLQSETGRQLQLADGDIVRVFRIGDILRNTVRLAGTAVYKPGTYQYYPGMTVADLVETAGGVLGDAFPGWAHLIRTKSDKQRQLISFNLAGAVRRDKKDNLALEKLDEVQVFSIWDMREKKYVSIEGQVRKPGRYEVLAGMTVADLIIQAGGLKESAYRLKAEVSRIDPEEISATKTATLWQVAMGDSLQGDGEASRFKLQENDIVFIREIPNWSLQENVWVTGEVKFPGLHSLTSKVERLSSVIERAGGLEETAYLRGATFIRKKGDTGRMAIDFDKALRRVDKNNPTKFDLVLVAGDSIHIPREPNTVKINGQVGYPSSVLWERGRDMDYYIDQAGGLLDSADKDKIRVVMANGRIRRAGWFSSPEPDAGATIIVPAKPEKKDTETLKTMAQLVSILTGAATTIYLISQASQ